MTPAAPVATSVYPVSLVLHGRRCLVVGGGHVARRKALGLVEAGARVDLVAKEVLASVREIAGLESIEERPYRRGEVAGYRLAVAATGDPAVNRAVFEDGESAGVWVNSPRPARSSSPPSPARAPSAWLSPRPASALRSLRG